MSKIALMPSCVSVRARLFCLTLLSTLSFGSLQAQSSLPAPVSLHDAKCGDASQKYDAIVIGAGIAGLTAAKELQHLKRSVLVLESNDRIGGRGFVGMVGAKDTPIDYGGAWIHGVDTNPLTGLVDDAGLKRARTDLSTRIYFGSEEATEKQRETYDAAVEEYEESLQRASQSIQNEYALAEFACHERKDHAKSAETVCRELAGKLPFGSQIWTTRMCQSQSLSPQKFCDLAKQVLKKTSDQSEDYLPKDHRFDQVRALVKANAGPLESAQELQRTSVVEGSAFLAGEDDLVDAGLGTFVQSLGKDVPVCLNSPVTAVDYRKGRVQVTAAGTTYTAATAVVTVSVGVLQAKKIAFKPELPEEKLNAIKNLQMGNMQKVIVPFSKDVFPGEHPNSWVLYEGNLSPDALKFAVAHTLPHPDNKLVMAFVFKPLGEPIAIGFFGGDWAKALEGECSGKKNTSGMYIPGDCDTMAVNITKDALLTMFQKRQQEVSDAMQLNLTHVTHWSLDPTSLGAYSVAAPKLWEQHAILAQPVKDVCKEDRLFFAGEGTARALYNGSYPGAYESGLKSAREIEKQLSEEPSQEVTTCRALPLAALLPTTRP